jgi:ubiquinone biosynthesis protein UbiJ
VRTDQLRNAQTQGELLRLLAYRARATQEVLAQVGGVTTSSIGGYMSDAAIMPAPTIVRISRFLAERLAVPSETIWSALLEVVDNTERIRRLQAEVEVIQGPAVRSGGTPAEPEAGPAGPAR